MLKDFRLEFSSYSIKEKSNTAIISENVLHPELFNKFQKSNTGLHYAAASGLKSCVELLVNHGCPLFVENEDSHTPCDCAESSSFNEIALYLESKMVFSVSIHSNGIFCKYSLK